MAQKHELQKIISGDGKVRFGADLQAIAAYLKGKTGTVQEAKKTKLYKEEETKKLIAFIESKNLWFTEFNSSKYIGEGAEQKVFEDQDAEFVLKANNSVYYSSWLDYFHNLLLHNYFFPHVSYEFKGLLLMKVSCDVL